MKRTFRRSLDDVTLSAQFTCDDEICRVSQLSVLYPPSECVRHIIAWLDYDVVAAAIKWATKHGRTIPSERGADGTPAVVAATFDNRKVD